MLFQFTGYNMVLMAEVVRIDQRYTLLHRPWTRMQVARTEYIAGFWMLQFRTGAASVTAP